MFILINFILKFFKFVKKKKMKEYDLKKKNFIFKKDQTFILIKKLGVNEVFSNLLTILLYFKKKKKKIG